MSIATPDYPERIAAARRLIEQRLDEQLPLEALAAAACLSPFHFHRLFRGLTGETVAACVRRLRLERAAHRIVQGPDDILAVALDAGYGSHEAFTRAFTRHFGVSPSEFRTRRRDAVAARAPQPPEEPDMDIRIESTDPCHVACVRHVGPYTAVANAWGQLMKWGWSKMMFGKPAVFGLCHDDPEVTEADRLRYDACMVVKAGTRVKPPVELRALPAGTYAVVEHVGPYDAVGAVYAGLCAQLATQPVAGKRWRLADPPAREHYLNDPRRTPPEQLRTEIWMPVAPA